MKSYDVIVIGGGPAGLAAAIAARKAGASVLLIEREARLGGILKQCIHDGFGLIRFGEKLSGPEYVERFIDEFRELDIECETLTFVTDIIRVQGLYYLSAVNRRGTQMYEARTLILATGCRERTAKQVKIHGTRPAGIFTAGTAQHFVNLMGQMPARRCVILGSGDIGLIMTRRLTLEGAKVLGVYEVKPEPSGLTRNIVQCLEDYDIPLYLSHTVTRVFGTERLEAVEVAQVDSHMRPIEGTGEILQCDALILSVGLIPENEMAEKLHIALDPKTKGPVCDNGFMTGAPGVFSCGNALHVNDLVDYVSESGELAGTAAAEYARTFTKQSAAGKLHDAGPGRTKEQIGSAPAAVPLNVDATLQYLVPQKVRTGPGLSKTVLYFRSREILKDAVLVIEVDGKTVLEKKYRSLKPPEMERLAVDFEAWHIGRDSQICIAIRKEGQHD